MLAYNQCAVENISKMKRKNCWYRSSIILVPTSCVPYYHCGTSFWYEITGVLPDNADNAALYLEMEIIWSLTRQMLLVPWKNWTYWKAKLGIHHCQIIRLDQAASRSVSLRRSWPDIRFSPDWLVDNRTKEVSFGT